MALQKFLEKIKIVKVSENKEAKIDVVQIEENREEVVFEKSIPRNQVSIFIISLMALVEFFFLNSL